RGARRPPREVRGCRRSLSFPSWRRSRVLEAVLLRVEDPLVALDHDGVAAGPRLAWHRRVPRHGVAESGVEGPEMLGRVDDGVPREVVLDAGLLGGAVEEIPGVVVVDGDEPVVVDVRRVLRHVLLVGLHLGRVRYPGIVEDRSDRVHALTVRLAAVDLDLQVGPAAPALEP